MVLFELERGQVPKTRMRAHGVVMLPPGFDDDLRLAARAKPLDAQAFVAEFAVERLIGAVLRRLTGVDDGGLDVCIGKPLQNGPADKFRAAVRSQVRRHAMLTHSAAQNFDDTGGANAAGNIDGQAFMRELIDYGEALELLTVGAEIEQKVIRPNVIGCTRR